MSEAKPTTEAGQCRTCGQRFSEKGLAIHRGIKHRTRRTVADAMLDSYIEGYDKGVTDERERVAVAVRDIDLFYPDGTPVTPEHIVTLVLALLQPDTASEWEASGFEVAPNGSVHVKSPDTASES